MSAEVTQLSGWQKTVLVVLRFAIGWHFFFQGFGKLISPYWTAEGYLGASWGPFKWITTAPWALGIADTMMVLGLMVVGILLMIGLFTRVACLLGIILLGMIYAAIPPLDFTGFVVSTAQGTELYVDKNLIEILALVVVASFGTGHIIGLDILVRHWWRNRK